MQANIDNKHWIYVFSKLSTDNKKKLKRYYSKIYPRDYVCKLIAAISGDNSVQFKKS